MRHSYPTKSLVPKIKVNLKRGQKVSFLSSTESLLLLPRFQSESRDEYKVGSEELAYRIETTRILNIISLIHSSATKYGKLSPIFLPIFPLWSISVTKNIGFVPPNVNITTQVVKQYQYQSHQHVTVHGRQHFSASY